MWRVGVDLFGDSEIAESYRQYIHRTGVEPSSTEIGKELALPPEEVETYPHACIGTVEEICESLEMRRERWDASFFVFQGDTMEPMAPAPSSSPGRRCWPS